MNWLRLFMWIVIVIAGSILAVVGYLYFRQERIIFLPRVGLELTPGEIGLEAEDVLIKVDDEVTLHGWYFPVDSSRPTVLFCHGNAGNISHRLETAEYLVSLGVNVMLFDYRGYGRSTGSPTESGVYTDARKYLDWLVHEKGTPLSRIVLFGRSLGGAVAVQLATEFECRGLIVESSFTSIPDMARTLYPWLPARYLARHKMASIDKIGRIKSPVLVMHSRIDEIIPYWMGEKLFQAVTAPRRFLELNADHNDLVYYDSDVYREHLLWVIDGSQTD